MDFDNVVIEDEDDCKTRFIEMCKKIGKLVEETARTLPEEIESARIHPQSSGGFRSDETEIKFNKTKDLEGKDAYSFIRAQYYYSDIDDIPEEVVCKALELLDDGIYNSKAVLKGYRITSYDYDNNERYGRIRTTKRVWIDGKEHDAFVGFTTEIRNKDAKYSKDLYNKFSEALK